MYTDNTDSNLRNIISILSWHFLLYKCNHNWLIYAVKICLFNACSLLSASAYLSEAVLFKGR